MRRSSLRFNKNKMQSPSLPKAIASDVETNIKVVQERFGSPMDLVIRRITIGAHNHLCSLLYFDGLVDTELVRQNVIEKLQQTGSHQQASESALVVDYLYQEWGTVSDIKKVDTFADVLEELLNGQTIFFMAGIGQALAVDTKGGETRSIEEPVSETLVRGPREGFVENIGINIALLRRYVNDPNLRFKTYQAGERSRKNLIVAYVEGVVHPDIVAEVNRRLKTMDTDNALESGYVEGWIEDSFLSPFPQIMNTERPDKTAAALLQGKVAIVLDGTPFVLIAPMTLGSVFQSPEDFYERWTVGTLLRLIRYFAAFVSLFLPGLYIALVSYQQGLLPSKIAFSIAASREGVPFPVFFEAMMMVGTMELLREAGARLPKTIGQTIGIVGGLVIGEAAVQAGIVSPIMVIVTALTALGTFSIPTFSVAISFRLLRFAIMFAASFMGLYGVILAYIMINIHIVNLKTFGIPYATPFAPTIMRDWNDLVLRAPHTMMMRRPKYLQSKDSRRGEKT
ncbi:spore germination protein [Bacillus piscicola]|uniref:spore germination protein n=1 Tax=Bacillus piscicola TaxID=1632684 RepID=UPI001F0913F2|nr:spore germination protein [Bacillus piscicola]